MRRIFLSIAIMIGLGATAHAHDPAKASYIANAGVLVTQGETKIMFDPLFTEGYGNYQTAPDELRAKMMKAEAPFDGIDAVFVSHAHDDHFSAQEALKYLTAQSDVRLIAPLQAVEKLRAHPDWTPNFEDRLTIIDLNVGDAPVELLQTGFKASAVRIPHSGNKSRQTIENIVYRVTLEESATVMHLGDADAHMEDYIPHEAHWKRRETDLAFPPYWLLTSEEGRQVLEYVHIKSAVGTHVPTKVPDFLRESEADYFSEPGEIRVINGEHEHDAVK